MDTKFTPGPWKACIEYSPIPWVYAPNAHLEDDKRNIITEMYPRSDGGVKRDEQEANAALIAASPELYAALDTIRESLWSGNPPLSNEKMHELCVSVLAKARGEMTAQQTLEREA